MVSNVDGQSAPAEELGPTDSHSLSRRSADQEENESSVNADDAKEGWRARSPQDLNQRIIPHIPNEDLWMLIRRFNKQMYSVRAIPEPPLQRLDLNRGEQEKFSPDKLRITLERFYIVIGLSLVNLFNHIVRLRSWRETRRTTAFCVTYFVSWLLDLLIPISIATLMALALYPPSRKWMFPPAPLAIVNSDTGGVQKPKAGVLGSHDSVTGAPERVKGEASEQEARNLMNSIGSLAVGSVVGKHDEGVPEDAPMEDSVPDATDVTSKVADAQRTVHGEASAESHDKTRQPMNASVVNGAGQAMRILGDVVDTYERFGNALSPTPPFSLSIPRLRIGAILGTALFLGLVTSSYVFMKMTTLGIGAGFFGDPIIQRAVEYLNREYPDWTKMLALENSLLKGIPTNAQLTLTLLRIGEASAAPLPPAQLDSSEKPPSGPASVNSSQVNLAVSKEEVRQAAEPGTPPHKEEENQSAKKPKKWISSIIGVFRRSTAAGIQSKLVSDRVLAVVGVDHAKERVGVLNRKGQPIFPAGPTEFAARYKGKRGVAVIDSSKDPPLLFFTTDPDSIRENPRLESCPMEKVRFVVPVSDIREMKKVGGLGWKAKIVAGWAFEGKEVVDGLVIVSGDKAQDTHQLMAMPLRDELFNRLLAIDGQVWEKC